MSERRPDNDLEAAECSRCGQHFEESSMIQGGSEHGTYEDTLMCTGCAEQAEQDHVEYLENEGTDEDEDEDE